MNFTTQEVRADMMFEDHGGYGGFDIYKTTLENGKWTTPVNIGQPFNSPANDLFYVGSSDGTVGYMSSSRKGGNGDMDIYKINYTDKLPKECKDNSGTNLALNVKEILPNGNRYELSAIIPDQFKKNIISLELKVDDSIIDNFNQLIEYEFKSKGTHVVKAKVVAWCDTCINLLIACNERTLEITNGEEFNTVLAEVVDLNSVHGELGSDLLKQLGFDLSSLYFDNNSSELRSDAVASLEKNIELLKKYPDLKIVLNGYTDAKGADENNRRLSKKRAAAAKQYLRNRSIDNKIDVNGKGESDLTNICSDGVDCEDAMHQKNRRVEIRVVKK